MKKLFLLISMFISVTHMQAQWSLTGNANATSSSILGTTNSVPLRLFTKNTPRIVIDTLGRVGIGITLPTTALMVRGSGGNPAAVWTNIGKPVFSGFGETNVGNADFILGMASSTLFNAIPRFAGRRSRGTLNVPTAVVNGDQLMSFSAFGYDGSAFQNPAEIAFAVDGVQSGTSVPTNITMSTGNNGVSRLERMRIGSNGDVNMNTNQFFLQKSTGNVGIGTATPIAKLQVTGDVLINSLTVGRGAGNISTNTATGVEAVSANTTGNYNTANGYQSLKFNTTGSDNTAMGTQALSANTTGSFNSANGSGALSFNTTGSSNSASGASALNANTTGNYNTATGALALASNTTGSYNTANGASALNANTTGDENTATGAFALSLNTSGIENTAHGYQTLYQNTTGQSNTASGYQALRLNTTGNYNTANGVEALSSNSTGASNTASGYQALRFNTTGYNNSANGAGTLSYNTTGIDNAAFGNNALYNNTTGYSNTADGSQALGYNTTGYNNTASGKDAMLFNTTGYYNSASGASSLYSNTIGIGNSASGASSLYSNTTGNYNTASGVSALYFNSVGIDNTAIGYAAGGGANGIDFNQCTFVGSQTSLNVGRNNVTMLGYGIADGQCTASNQVLLGNTSVSQIRAQVSGITSYSDARYKANVKQDVKGLDFINLLRPVSYNVKPTMLHKIWGTPDSLINKLENSQTEQVRYTGFIAQDVEKAMRESGYNFTGIDIPATDNETYTLRYTEFIMPLVKAVQELSVGNEQLKKEKAEQSVVNATLQQQINELKALLTGSTAKPVAAINQKEVSFETASLEQNIPNPPSGNFTRINYNIPTGATRAEMMIVDNAGRKIKTISLNTFGKGVLNVDTKGLLTGTYSYSMIVDGKVIDTKQMVVVK